MIVEPLFAQLGPYCLNATPDNLSLTSDNGITGTWNPAAIATGAVGTTTYTFTPDAGQCAVPVTMDIEITDEVEPIFTQLGPYCLDSKPDDLPLISNNGITGTWNPATISTSTVGIKTYTYTPDADSVLSR